MSFKYIMPTLKAALWLLMTNGVQVKACIEENIYRFFTICIRSNGSDLERWLVSNTFVRYICHIRVCLKTPHLMVGESMSFPHVLNLSFFFDSLIINRNDPQEIHFFQSVHRVGHSSDHVWRSLSFPVSCLKLNFFFCV